MKTATPITKPLVYRAPIAFVWVFYSLLVTWTAVCIVFLAIRTSRAGWPLGQLLMISFVLAYTWYFSLGISYRVEIDDDGSLHFFSFRRQIRVHAKEISMVEGPRFALIPYSFLRFRLEREKAYLFCRTTGADLHRIFKRMRAVNGDIAFKGL